MAENWAVAFGGYLRTLRERRGLSIHAVTVLSQPFAEKLTKGYVSRCENGKVRLALSKVIPLGHIYKVSADVVLERIDLDMELDRLGSPDTHGMTYSALLPAAASGAGPAALPSLAVAPFESAAPPGREPPDVATLLADRMATRGTARVVRPSFGFALNVVEIYK